MKAKLRLLGYWVVTALLALAFVAGGIGDLSGAPQVAAGMGHLGYPLYFAKILGVWKLAGAVALVIPRFPRLKEWAYAGMVFDLTGAAASHAAVGDPTGNIVNPLVLVLFVAASWALRGPDRKLASVASVASVNAPENAPQPK